MLHTKSLEDVLYLEQTSCHILNEKMSEIERLQKEAEYLARLIKDHKSRSASSSSHTSVAAAGAAAPRAYCNPSQVPYRQTSWHGRPTTTADNHAVRRKTQSHRASDAKSSIDHKQSKPPYKPPSRTQTNREVKLSTTSTKTWSTSQSKSTVSAAVAGNVGKVAASGDPPPIVHIVPSTSSCRDLKLTKATTVKLSQSNISSSIPRTGSLSGNKSSCPAESGGPKEKTASSVGATKNNPVVTTDKIEAAQNLLLQIKKSMSSGQDGHSTKHLPSSPRKAQHPSRYKFEKRETLEPKQTSASTRSSGVLQNQKSHYEDTGHHNRRVVLPTRYKQNVNTSKLKASRYRFVKGHANLSPAQYPRDLSSIAKSPAMVVKLRTKYKLVKKAKLTKQRFMSNRLSSRKHGFSRSRTYSASPRPKPRVTRYSYHGTSAQGGARFTQQGAAGYSPRYNRYKLIRYGVQSYNSSKFTSGLNYRRRMVTRNVGRFSVSRSGATHYQRRSSVSSTPSGKTVTVRGDFVVGKRGKSLRRVSREKPYFPNVSKLKSTTVKTYTSTRMSAFKALQRSKFTVTAPKKKAGKAEYCKFYSRFGRCSRGTKCKFIHDPKRVALCTRFLRGTCTLTNCAFSHDVSAEKMPVCSYFLKGICNRDKCPYSHVNVSKDADVCLDFVSGFCPLGSKCKKRHTLVCPEYQKTGKCLEGKKCAMKHNHSKARKRAKSDSKPRKDEPRLKQVKMDATKSYTPLGDLEVPFKERELPSFISLSTSGTAETDESTNVSKEATPKLAKSPLIIRPRFSFEKK